MAFVALVKGFRSATFVQVDRAIVLRLVVDDDEASIEELLDCSAYDIREQGARAACLVAVVAMRTPDTELMTEARDGSGASSEVPRV